MPPISPTDLRRSRAGDPASRARVATRAATLAVRTSTAILASTDDAQDVAQDVAVDVLRDLHQLRSAEAFDGWVHRITVRHALRLARRRRRRSAAEAPLALLLERDEPAVASGADDVVDRELLAAAMARLPVRQRAAMALRYVHDLPDREIAAALDCRTGTVHALLSRARRTLRDDPAVAAVRAPAPTVPTGGITR